MEMANAYQRSQVLFLVTKLGIPDLLKDGPKSGEDLASQLQAAGTVANGEYVRRLMRAAAALGILHRADAPSLLYSLNEVSQLLLDGPTSMKWAVLHLSNPAATQYWSSLEKTIVEGSPAFPQGLSYFQFLEKSPQHNEWFNNAMTTFSSQIDMGPFLAERYSDALDHAKTIVDVGGGEGVLAAQILRAKPHLKGIIFDMPHVVEKDKEKITHIYSDLDRSRITFVGGNFFEKVPSGGDIYFLKSIIHDWNDEKSVEILSKIREELSPEGRVAVLDRNVKEVGDVVASFMDLHMLAVLGAKERNEKEFQHIFERAGLQLTRIIELKPSPYSLVEGKRKA